MAYLDTEAGATRERLGVLGTETAVLAAVTADAAEINTLDGHIAGTAQASRAMVVNTLNQYAGVRLKFASKVANYTLTTLDSGQLIEAAAVDLVFTLPAGSVGLEYIITVKTPSTTTGLSISPAAADKIMGAGITSLDNKDLINTAATDREGDMVHLVADGVDGWYIVAMEGTWAREA